MAMISPSILSADFGNLEHEIRTLPGESVDYLHLDIMDGHFVPDITFGFPVVQRISKLTGIPLDIHLMVTNPEDQVERFLILKPAILTFHLEAATHPERLCRRIREGGSLAGVALNPATPWDGLKYISEAVDLVLVMTVNPGFGGQKFMTSVLEKIREIKNFTGSGRQMLLEVDGGINDKTAPLAIGAGANLLVAGNYIFSAKDRTDAIKRICEPEKRP
ncbi:MAG: ribulose-phosphate 3-epimerase [Candidatus Wallbacteria bacterium]|nr:ribulose-phosphate 3-epimerase [Candidatus Wallbacteria bacterium]